MSSIDQHKWLTEQAGNLEYAEFRITLAALPGHCLAALHSLVSTLAGPESLSNFGCR